MLKFAKRPLKTNNLFLLLVILITVLGSCKKQIDFTGVQENVWYVSDDMRVALNFESTSDNISGKFIQTGNAISEINSFSAKKKRNQISFHFKDLPEASIDAKKLWTTDDGLLHITKKDDSDLTFYLIHQPTLPENIYHRYVHEVFPDVDRQEVTYGEALGYYSGKPVENISFFTYPKIIWDVIKGLGNNVLMNQIELKMDVYSPVNDSISLRPLIILVHGGAFIVGDKRDRLQENLAKHFASLGYVVACVNYRLGYLFIPGMYENFERAKYRAVQDVRAALRFLTQNHEDFGIDPDYFFLAGNSAGGFITLYTAFLGNHQRWNSTHENILMLRRDLGCLDCSTNDARGDYRIAAIANMWGAMADINIIEEDEKLPALLIHGDNDRIVPYDYDYPFRNFDTIISSYFSKKVHGSKPVYERMKELGFEASLFTIYDGSHEPQINRDGSPSIYYSIISEKLTDFFYENLVTDSITISGSVEIISNKVASKYTLDVPKRAQLFLQTEGGVVIDKDVNSVEIVWTDKNRSGNIKLVAIDEMGRVYMKDFHIKW